MKKVAFGTKPKRGAASEDGWVKDREVEIEAEPMKRLTLDVPLSLHTRIKVHCTKQGKKMSDELRALLEREFVEKT